MLMFPLLERADYVINMGEYYIHIAKNNLMVHMTYEDKDFKKNLISKIEVRNKMISKSIKFCHFCENDAPIIKLNTLLKIYEKQIIKEQKLITEKFEIVI